MPIFLDTLETSKKLKKSGLKASTANSLAKTLKQQENNLFKNLASKNDLEKVRTELKHEIKHEIKDVRSEMNLMEERLNRKIDNQLYKIIGALITILTFFKLINF